ncbi:hypothetical protein ATY75_31645 [Rhizobium sp. N122]|nr:hypothetical protein ATY75_31645 [Rhizobium sp. N122]
MTVDARAEPASHNRSTTCHIYAAYIQAPHLISPRTRVSRGRSDSRRDLCRSAAVTADLTASAARRGLRCFEFLTRLARSIDHGDAVEVLSDYVEGELEEYPREVARLCEAGSRTLSHAAEMCRDVAAGQANEAEAKTLV